MVQEEHLFGYENFVEFAKKLDSKKEVNVYFTGTKTDGVSWCPDCNVAEPFVKESVKSARADSMFVIVEVGDRGFWKDIKCPFRTDKKTHLSVIPTLVRWGAPQRLEGEQCANADLLKMFFSEEDD